MKSPKRILTPKDALLHARIRPRNAPKAHMGARMQGRIRWGLIDRGGIERFGGEQSNLILDTFLDAIGQNSESGGFVGTAPAQEGTAVFTIQTWLTHACVGEGSTAPDVTDTALDTEIARTSSIISYNATRPTNGTIELTLTYEFDFADGNGNLTEWGIANASAGGVLVRELFRDGVGTPVTVTKTSDYKLRIEYTLEISISPVTFQAASFTLTGIGVINGTHSFIGGNGDGASDGYADFKIFSRVARGLVGTDSNTTYAVPNVHTARSWTYTTDQPTANHLCSSVSAGAYTPGSYQRTIASAAWDTSKANITIGEFVLFAGDSSIGNRASGWVFLIDSADRFTKDSLHQLTITDMLTVSWARA